VYWSGVGDMKEEGTTKVTKYTKGREEERGKGV
jgi:hypothetical protein